MFGNLTKAVVNSGTSTTTIEYVIDGMGRRVARRTNGDVDRIWLYRDGLRPVSEVDGKGVFTHFIYESNNAESGAPDALIRSGVLYRVVKDHLGSVRLVVNAQTGAIAQSIDYDAYGVVLSETGAGFQPFGFAGGLYDATTKLVRFGARDYDASTGRWTNRDPIGFAGGQGNQYLYVNGDPVNRVDRRGTDWLAHWRALGADLVSSVLEIVGYAQVSSAMGNYQRLQKECEAEIRAACSGDDWLEVPYCYRYRGGVEKDGIKACILDKDPEAWDKLMGSGLSI